MWELRNYLGPDLQGSKPLAKGESGPGFLRDARRVEAGAWRVLSERKVFLWESLLKQLGIIVGEVEERRG